MKSEAGIGFSHPVDWWSEGSYFPLGLTHGYNRAFFQDALPEDYTMV